MNDRPPLSEKLALKPGLTLQQFSQTFLLFSGSLLFSCLNAIPPTQAQIIPDATLPVNSTVTPQGNINQIDGGTQAGGNLFHSFQEFSIPTGSEAFFNNSLDIQNIFTRVTGNSISNIDGLIRANGFANLFLLNPNGIVFGPNAQLNIGGSFLASTANQINFADGTAFSTLSTETNPLLTVSVPVGLQMGVNPGKIVVQGPGVISPPPVEEDTTEQAAARFIQFQQEFLNAPVGLKVQPGRTLAVLGGEVTLEGGILKAPSGRIELGGVAGSALVNLHTTNAGFAVSYPEVSAFGNIQLSQQAAVSASGEGGGEIQVQGGRVRLDGDSAILAATLGSQNGGNVSVQAVQLSLTEGSAISTSTLGQGAGGDLTVNTSELVEIMGTSPNDESSSLLAETFVGGTAGNLTLNTGQLTMRDGARVSTTTGGMGQGGNLSVMATEAVQVSGTRTNGTPGGLFSEAFGAGNAGDLRIETGQLILNNGAAISTETFGVGNAGNLFIQATDFVEVVGTRPNGLPTALSAALRNGDNPNRSGGNLTIETGTLSIRDGGRVATATFAPGNAGNIHIRARDLVEVVGQGPATSDVPNGLISRISSGVSVEEIGNGGSITIETQKLSIRDGGTVSASARVQQGNSGDIQIWARERVDVDGTASSNNGLRSSIEANLSSDSGGKGGNITIDTGVLNISNGGTVSASVLDRGNSGEIQIRARERVDVLGTAPDGGGSLLTTFLPLDSVGKAGDLTIDTQVLSIRDGGQVRTDTDGQGDGGNLHIRATDLIEVVGEGPDLPSETISGGFSSILSSSIGFGGVGRGGNITLETQTLSIRDGGRISAGIGRGRGQGGDIQVRANDLVEVVGAGRIRALPDGSFIRFPSELTTGVSSEEANLEGSINQSGNINIETQVVSLRDSGQISAGTLGIGNAGSIDIRASERLEITGVSLDSLTSGISSNVFPGSLGKGGDININTQVLSLRNGGEISASTNSVGDAGNINIQAIESVDIQGDSPAPNQPASNLSSIVLFDADGNGGTISVNTQRLMLNNEGYISVGTGGNGNAGSIILKATESVLLSNESEIEAFTLSDTGMGGRIMIETGRLYLASDSGIFADTATQTQAGDIRIEASESVQLNGGSDLSVSSLATGDFGSLLAQLNGGSDLSGSTGTAGDAGSLSIKTGQLIVREGSQISADTFGTGTGGNLTIDVEQLIIRDGSQVGAATFGAGNAGNVSVIAEEVELAGTTMSEEQFPSGLFASSQGEGAGGSLIIEAGRLVVRDGAGASVSSTTGQRGAGNLVVTAGSVELDNDGVLGATTAAGNQGNINLNSQSLILRRNSRITTNATGSATGGNININTGSLAALENSDISANSEQAQGGTVTIDAQAIFGTEFRESPTSNSDITATGADSSLSGTVSINTPEIDPTSGLVELPTTLTDVAQQIDSSCRRGQQQNEFVVTGRGGLPPNPIEAISDEATWIDLRPQGGVLSEGNPPNSSSVAPSNSVLSTPTPQLVEVQGWAINENGQVELVARSPAANPQNPALISENCYEQ